MSTLWRKLESSLAVILVGLTTTVLMAVAQQKPTPPASTKPKARTKSKPKAATPTPAIQPVESEPLVALTRSQLPAVPPHVEYRDGQLAIAAENSTLGDILRAVHQQTGATVDMPANANERVVAHLGPGPARDILATLLDGSNFNYVMLGSATDATVVQRLIVSAKPSGNGATAEEPPPVEAAAQPRTPFGNNGPYRAAQTDSDDSGEPEVQSEEQAEEQSTDEPAEDQSGSSSQPTNQPTIKSPEQLLQELQRQQQQLTPRPQAAPQGFPVPPGQMPPEQNQPQPPEQ